MTGQWPAPVKTPGISHSAATRLKLWPTPKQTRERFSTSARSAFDGAAPQTAVCGARPHRMGARNWRVRSSDWRTQSGYTARGVAILYPATLSAKAIA